MQNYFYFKQNLTSFCFLIMPTAVYKGGRVRRVVAFEENFRDESYQGVFVVVVVLLKKLF